MKLWSKRRDIEKLIEGNEVGFISVNGQKAIFLNLQGRHYAELRRLLKGQRDGYGMNVCSKEFFNDLFPDEECGE